MLRLNGMKITLPIRRLTLLIVGTLAGVQCASPPTQSGAQAAPQTPTRGPSRIAVSSADAQKIGRKIWQNEAAGKVSGLTAWNHGEAFASMGIGHFIWYPAGVPQTYEESFRPLLAFFSQRGVALPEGITPRSPCPWNSRSAFVNAAQSGRMRALRDMLAATVGLQTEFIIERMQASLPKMIQAAPPSDRQRITDAFYAVSETPNGLYALIDYVNFKGEGTNPKERYQGQGWGLLQVLQGMQGRPRGQKRATQ